MHPWVVIPARLASSRLPEKPLQDFGGIPLVAATAEAAKRALPESRVLVAADHSSIVEACAQNGIDASLTPDTLGSGTERCAWLIRNAPEVEALINVQVDEPFVRAEDLQNLSEALVRGAEMATLYEPINALDAANPHQVKVVTDQWGRALYFSRARIPFPHTDHAADLKGHIGIYAYSRESLLALAEAEPTDPERAESLEQLRALHLGITIDCIRSRGGYIGIDTPEDLEGARKRLREQADHEG